ncbi:MAG: PAS domain-containing protein, partial [Melioribacteraceae bacterium]
MEKRIFKMSKDFLTRKSSVVVLLIFMLIAISGAVSIRYTWNRVVKQNSEEAIKTAKIAANSLNGEMLKKLSGVQEDAGTIAYVSIKKRLINIKSILSDARFVYLFTKREGKIFFIADSEPENSKDYSPPGQEYSEVDTSFIKFFDSAEELITPPITDRWGTWVSVLVPMKDESTGRTIAVFGMDYDADRWKSSIVFDVLRASVVIVIAFLLFLILSIKLVLQNKVLKNEAIERKHTESELKESEEKFRSLLEESPNMIFINKAGRVVYVNKKCEEILGYTRDEFLDPRFNFLDIIAPEHIEMVKENFANRYKGKAKDSYDLTLITKDKRRIETSTAFKIINYEGENAILGIVTDITEHKYAEGSLQKERLLLRTVIDNIPDSIYCKDIAGRKTLANVTELSYSGVKTEKEILGKTDFDFYPKELAEGFFSDDQLVIQSGQPILNREEYLLDEKGEKQWLLTSKIPLKDEKGIILGLVGIGRNITTRKRAEEALRENEIKLNVILQSTADGILAVDGNGKVIKTNGRFAQLWNIPQSLIDSGDDNVLLDFILDQLVNPEDFISKVKKLYNSTEEDLDMLLFKDGRIFERYSAPLIMSDTSIGRVWSFRDITEHKHAEGSLQKERLLLRTVIDNIPDSIYCKDIAGRKTLANVTELS